MTLKFVRIMVCAFGFSSALCAFPADSVFFRVQVHQTVPDPFITELNPFDGVISLSNLTVGATNQIQHAYDLSLTNGWYDYVQLVSTSSVLTLKILDLQPPEGMVYVPSGIFTMGDTLNEGGAFPEQPLHDVYVSAFYIGRCEVTMSEWNSVYAWATNSGGYVFDNEGIGKGADHPISAVNWFDAVKWCNARSEMEGKMPCYYVDEQFETVLRSGQLEIWCNWTSDGYRLPTEAQWEKAARGGQHAMRFPWGDTISHDVANYYAQGNVLYDDSRGEGYHPLYEDENDIPYTSPVGSFEGNGYGLCDTAGNLWEWCWDWYDFYYYALSPGEDPLGPDEGVARILRGGSYNNLASGVRNSVREISSGAALETIGFRVCLPVD